MTDALTDEELLELRLIITPGGIAEKLLDEVERLRGLEQQRDAEIDRVCAEYAAEHDRQCKASQDALDASEQRAARLEARLKLYEQPVMFGVHPARVLEVNEDGSRVRLAYQYYGKLWGTDWIDASTLVRANVELAKGGA